jgi:hypothetical protein
MTKIIACHHDMLKTLATRDVSSPGCSKVLLKIGLHRSNVDDDARHSGYLLDILSFF